MATAPTLATILTNIKTQIEAVSSIGNVLDRPRDAVNPEDFDTLFIDTTSGTVRCWIIDIGTSDALEDVAGNLFVTTRTVTVEGFLAFNQTDNSQATFQALVDAVQSKINGNSSIFGSCPLFADTGTSIQVDFASLGNVLCHHASIQFLVESTEVVS